MARFVSLLVVLVCAAMFAVVIASDDVGAMATQLVNASLRNGDYGGGAVVNTFAPNHGGSPGVPGVVDGPDGVTFTSTEPDGQSNGMINYALGFQPLFRNQGTVSLRVYADSTDFVTGWIVVDNGGYNTFRNGQSTFAIATSRIANGPGPEDDTVQLYWQTWHAGWWFTTMPRPEFELDRWHHVGFAWGDGDNDFKMCIDGVVVVAADLPAGRNLPWGGFNSGKNFGIGDNHERGFNEYNGAAGITFADFHVWDEPRVACDTVAPLTTLAVGIAVKPPRGEDAAPVNPKSKGVIPVAILSSADFDAVNETMKPLLTFGRTGGEASLRGCDDFGEDVDGDGLLDLVCRFDNETAGFETDDTEAILRGQTTGGLDMEGTAPIRIVGGGKK